MIFHLVKRALPIFFLLASLGVDAQRFAYGDYFHNPFYFNPAAAGNDREWRSRFQWATSQSKSLEGMPTDLAGSFILTVDKSTQSKWLNPGLRVEIDPGAYQQIDFANAVKWIKGKHYFSAGLDVGYNRIKERLLTMNPDTLYVDYVRNRFRTGYGIFYDNPYLAASVTISNVDFLSGDNPNHQVPQTGYWVMGKIPLPARWYLFPSLHVFRYLSRGYPLQVNMAVDFWYRSRFFGGVGYRMIPGNDGVRGALTSQFGSVVQSRKPHGPSGTRPRMRVGAGFNLNIARVQMTNLLPGAYSAELLFGYDFGKRIKS